MTDYRLSSYGVLLLRLALGTMFIAQLWLSSPVEPQCHQAQVCTIRQWKPSSGCT
jgi:hypothetical protein